MRHCFRKTTWLRDNWYQPGDPSLDSENVVCAAARHFGLVRYPHKKFTSKYYERANKKLENGDYKGAISDYTKVMKSSPNNKGLYFLRGWAKSESKDYSGAISDLTKNIKLDPNTDTGYYQRGLTYKILKNYSKAIDDFNKELQINPNNLLAIYGRGETKFYNGNIEGGCNDWRKASQLGFDVTKKHLKKCVIVLYKKRRLVKI